MKKADQQLIFGDIFDTAQKGFQFGYNLKNGIEENKLRNKQFNYQLAEAQQRAANAKLDQQRDQQKIINERNRITLERDRLNQNIHEFDVQGERDKEKRQYDLDRDAGKELEGAIRLEWNLLTPEQKRDPAIVKQYAEKMRAAKEKQIQDELRLAQGKANITTKALGDRANDREGIKQEFKADPNLSRLSQTMKESFGRMEQQGKSPETMAENLKPQVMSAIEFLNKRANKSNADIGQINQMIALYNSKAPQGQQMQQLPYNNARAQSPQANMSITPQAAASNMSVIPQAAPTQSIPNTSTNAPPPSAPLPVIIQYIQRLSETEGEAAGDNYMLSLPPEVQQQIIDSGA